MIGSMPCFTNFPWNHFEGITMKRSNFLLGRRMMRISLVAGLLFAATTFIGSTATAQQPRREKSADEPPPAADPSVRRGRRGGEDEPPTPGKAANRLLENAPRAGFGEDSGRPGPQNNQNRFGGGFGGGMRGPGGGGYGGGGGGFGGGYGVPGGMPGAPGMMPGGNMFGPDQPDDPEMRDLVKQDADMERQTVELSMRVHELRGEEQNKVKAQLAELLNKHFDVRQKRRELQIKRMEEELQRLKEAIAKRNESRKLIVENRFRELVGEPRDLDF
jgi:hypothetical protein